MVRGPSESTSVAVLVDQEAPSHPSWTAAGGGPVNLYQYYAGQNSSEFNGDDDTPRASPHPQYDEEVAAPRLTMLRKGSLGEIAKLPPIRNENNGTSFLWGNNNNYNYSHHSVSNMVMSKKPPSRPQPTPLQDDDDDDEFPPVPRKAIAQHLISPSPNDPHPALEFPMFYGMLKSLGCSDAMRRLYRVRWHLAYPLQRRLPCSRVLLRKLRIFWTWGELLFLLPFFATLVAGSLYTFLYPSVAITGHACRTPLIFAFVTAMHNSYLTLLLGIPFERALFYHKLSARIAYINAILHTYVAYNKNDNNFGRFLVLDGVNTAGTCMMVFMTVLVVTALPWVRHKVFELFYYCHLLFAVATAVGAFYHTGFLVPLLVGLTLGVDMFVRRAVMATCLYPKKAHLRIVSDTVVEVVLPKTFDYNPGQYVFLAVPQLTIFQWHPFSLSSSPLQKVVTLHIRKAGAWTTALYELAKQQDGGTQVNVMLEGPYGSVGVDLSRYKTMLLFSGGIGVTPMQSICNQVMHEHNTGKRRLRRLVFVWVERDPIVLNNVDAVRTSTNQHKRARVVDNDNATVMSNAAFSVLTTKHNYQDIASTVLSVVPASYARDDDDDDYPEDDMDDDDDDWMERDEEETVLREAYRAGPLDLRVHLTAKRNDESQELLDQLDEFPFVRLGRPDMKQLFREMREEALACGEGHVAVCICAPKRLVRLCEAACAKYSKGSVRFDFHHEVFD